MMKHAAELVMMLAGIAWFILGISEIRRARNLQEGQTWSQIFPPAQTSAWFAISGAGVVVAALLSDHRLFTTWNTLAILVLSGVAAQIYVRAWASPWVIGIVLLGSSSVVGLAGLN